MFAQGHIHNGVVVLDEPSQIPEGTPVRVEILDTVVPTIPGRRQGGQYAGQIRLAADFDQWPIDL